MFHNNSKQMSAFTLNDPTECAVGEITWMKSFSENTECVFKKCCEKYKKKGKHCKKCPKK